MPAGNSIADPARAITVTGSAPTALALTAEVRALGAALLSPELIIFPVRHHSPACAWQLRKLFQDLTPCAVLVEGPQSFTPLIPLLTHPEARMPLAVYTYAVHKAKGDVPERRRAAYYPFCDHSPELVALQAAAERGIPARFIDLDFGEQAIIETEANEEAESLLEERHFQRSQYLQQLAGQLGCRDHEELWEHLFEVSAGHRTLSQHVQDVAAYCHLSRVDSSHEELAADGTLQREAEMVRHICEALAARQADDGPVLVVVGGFHAVVIRDLLAAAAPPPTVRRSGVSEEATALIRYSFERLDRLNGYASGMTSPAWHQRVWEEGIRRDRAKLPASPRQRHDAALALLFDIATELRTRHAISLPMPALAAAYEQVLRLTELRGRPAPVRADVLDAVTSCFVKGDADADGALVLGVARRAFTGDAVGKVPPGASTPPLVRDFAWRARRQRLKIDEPEPRRAVLDLYRRADHRLTSRLLHGLSLLGVPFAFRTAGPDFVAGTGTDRLQEHWEYTYGVATEASLVEASVHGATVPLAVANRFAARLDLLEAEGGSRDARMAAGLLVHACVMGLHDHLPRVVAALRLAIGRDASFESVAAASASLGLLWESREPLETRDLVELPILLEGAYERAVFLGQELGGSYADLADRVKALLRLRELLVSAAGKALDNNLYWEMVANLLGHESALIRGAASGLLYSAGRLDETALASTLNGHLNGLSQPPEAVSFLRGLLQTAREAAWQQPELIGVLDRLFSGWDEAAFVAILPELRLAFAEMTPKETDRIAEAVTTLHGGVALGSLTSHTLSADDVQANLLLSQRLTELLQADGLQGWLVA